MASEATQQTNRAGMDRKRLLVITFSLLGIVVALFLAHLIEKGMAALAVKNYQVVEGLAELSLANLLGFAVTGGAVAWVFKSPGANRYVNEVAEEMMRVTWPGMDETWSSTVAVVVASLVAAVILFGMDTLSYQVMVEWLPAFWGKL